MLYPFEDVETGAIVELAYSMKDPELPSIGDVIEHPEEPGRRLRRLMADCVAGRADRGFKPFASNALPLHAEGAPRYDKMGRAVFNSKREVREFFAHDRAKKAGYGWDGKL